MDRIAIVAPLSYVNGRTGGIARYTEQQFKNLPGYSNRRFGIHKLTFKQYDNKIETELDSFRIIHNLTENPAPVHRKGKIIVNSVHEFQILLYPNLSTPPVGMAERLEHKRLSKAFSQILKSDYLIANSEQTKKEGVSLGFDGKRIFIANLGIDRRFSQSKSVGEKRGKLFQVGYIGAIRHRKNIGFALETAKNLDKSMYRMNLYGVLFSDFKSQLNAFLSKNKGIVSYKGLAPERDIVDIYDGFDAFLMPSRYEGFGLGIPEAQARGLPVIIYKDSMIASETRRYCIEAKTPEHAAEILDDIRMNGYNEKVGRKAMTYARSFTWDKTAGSTIAAYKRIIYSN